MRRSKAEWSIIPASLSSLPLLSGDLIFIYEKIYRKFDAGIMELGLIYSDANSIPPGQKAFPITAYCVEDCTKKVFF